MYQLQRVKDKDVFIVNYHQKVLLPWSIIRRKLAAPPNLITLDHHTDTIEAFHDHVFFAIVKNEFDMPDDFREQYNARIPSLIGSINWNNDSTITHAISNLDWDEHIDAALRSGVIQLAVSINLNAFTSSSVENQIIQVSSNCALDCTKQPHDDACQIEHYSQVIESNYLERMLEKANKVALSAKIDNVESSPYILDIDLDYFHSEKSIAPDDTSTIYRLIRNAEAITLALEPTCVEELKVKSSKITSESLLDSMLEHISKAQE